MPSRKRNKGKARKANKAAAELRGAANAATNLSGEDNVGIFTGVLSAPMACFHGTPQASMCENFEIVDFINTFAEAFHVARTSNCAKQCNSIAAYALRIAYDKYPDALSGSRKDVLLRALLATGTQHFVNTNLACAHGCAYAMITIEAFDPDLDKYPNFLDTWDAKNCIRNKAILVGCARTLMKFFVKRVSCKCLDLKYAKVKADLVPKISKCDYCVAVKERNTLLLCTGCKRTLYCNEKCQAADWADHKKNCKCWHKFGPYVKSRHQFRELLEDLDVARSLGLGFGLKCLA